MPGAMLGFSVALLSTREDWWRRAAILGFLGAIGWAFAGTASYGLLIGYSQGGSWLNSAYGYVGLFLVGGLYGGIGAAILSMGLTSPRSSLDKYLWPMVIIYCSWLLLEWTGWKAWSLAIFEKSPDRPMETKWLYGHALVGRCRCIRVGGLHVGGYPKMARSDQLDRDFVLCMVCGHGRVGRSDRVSHQSLSGRCMGRMCRNVDCMESPILETDQSSCDVVNRLWLPGWWRRVCHR